MNNSRLFAITLLSVLLALVSTCYAAGDKIVVRPPKTIKVPSDFPTIGAAIENAVQGDTIEVGAGTYTETLSISKDNLTIKGAGRDSTSISGNSSTSVVVVRNTKCTFQNITVQGGHNGVYCLSGELSFSECRIQNNLGYAGILAKNASYVYCSNTDINGNKYGLIVAQCSQSFIEKCNIFSNSAEGVAAWYTATARIASCDIYNNGANGIQIGAGSSCELYLTKVHGNTYSGIDVSQLSALALRGGNDIYSNADNSGWRAGIGVYHSSNVVATLLYTSEKEDIYLNNGPGLFISNNSSLFLKSGEVYQNKGNGVSLHLNSTAQLEDVSVANNSGYGIACNAQSFLSKTGATTITGNTLGDTDNCW